MDFSTNIIFSDDLIENQKTTITYSGYLFERNSSSLKIVYGFGDNWMYTNEQEMEKTENGFVATIRMLNFSKFNFCFKNANNEWDNNFGSNFVAPISELKIDEKFVLNENVVENILTNLVKYDVSKIESPKIQSFSEPLEQYESNFASSEENEDIEIIDNIDVKPLEEIEDSPIIEENDDSFEVYYEENEAIDISETVENEFLDDEINADLNKEFNDLYEGKSEDETQETVEEDTTTQFDINKFSSIFDEIENIKTEKDTTTVDNLVSSLVNNLYENSKKIEAEEKEKISELFESIFEESKETDDSKDNFQVAEEEGSLIDNLTNTNDEIEVKPARISVEPTKLYKYSSELGLVVSHRSLNPFYRFKKKVKIAFYKMFTAIPRMLSENNQ